MDNRDKISIIIPVYNSEEKIERCINSIINQTYNNIEIICIDDGSTDESNNIIQKLKEKEPRLNLISQKNNGVSSARNTGISNSSGKYIMFVDSDDYIEKDMVEKMYKALKSNNSELVICNYYIKNNIDIVKHNSKRKSENFVKEHFIKEFDSLFEKSLINQPWNKLYIKSKIKELFNIEFTLGEDLLFNISYIYGIDRITYIDENLYVYNTSGENSLTKIKYHTLKDFFYIYNLIIKRIYREKSIKVSYKFKFKIIRSFLHNLILMQKHKKFKERYIFLKTNYKQFEEFKINQNFNSILDRIIFSKENYKILSLLYAIFKG